MIDESRDGEAGPLPSTLTTGVELSERLSADPVEGWKALVEAYSGLVWSIARGMRLGQQDAEEVYQNTWLLLYRYARGIRDARSLPAWIATTARREAMVLVRRERLRRDVESVHGEGATGISAQTPSNSADEREESLLLMGALLELSPRCRSILSRLYYSPGEITYKQLAEELGMPIGSLGPTRLRCLERLAVLLEARGV